MFFKKKIEETNQSQELTEDTSIQKKPLQNIDEVLVELEKVKAQIEAGEELRKLYNEKFSKFDQDIGEFRNMIIERDKDIQTFEIKATKAADLVSEIKPEAIQASVMKFETKMEMLKAKLDANEQINERIMEELKELRSTVKAFRGVAEIEKLTKEMLGEQAVIRKIQGKIENYADKTESMYMETEKKYEEFRHFKDIIEDLDAKLSNENKTIKEIRLKVDEEKRLIDQEVENAKKETAKMRTYNDVLDELKKINATQNEQIKNLNIELITMKKQNEISQTKNKETLLKIHTVLTQIKEKTHKNI